MQRTHLNRIAGCLAFLFFIGSAAALANIQQIKNYKEAFPGEKPKCTLCHVDALPKKEADKHALNAYGQKVVALKQMPTAADYTTAGKA